MIILGIGGILGDATCAILKDGELVAAIEESKLARVTHAGAAEELPERAIAACLEMAKANPSQVDAVALVRPVPESTLLSKLRAQFPQSRIVLLEHHLAHAASAYYPSPFRIRSAIFTDASRSFWASTPTKKSTRCNGSPWPATIATATCFWKFCA